MLLGFRQVMSLRQFIYNFSSWRKTVSYMYFPSHSVSNTCALWMITKLKSLVTIIPKIITVKIWEIYLMLFTYVNKHFTYVNSQREDWIQFVDKMGFASSFILLLFSQASKYNFKGYIVNIWRWDKKLLSVLCACAKLLQSHPALCNPTECSPSGSSVHGILQGRILECVAMPSSRETS